MASFHLSLFIVLVKIPISYKLTSVELTKYQTIGWRRTIRTSAPISDVAIRPASITADVLLPAVATTAVTATGVTAKPVAVEPLLA